MKALNIRFNAPKVEAKLANLIDDGDTALNKSQLARAAMNIGLDMLSASQSSMTNSEFSRHVDGEQ